MGTLRVALTLTGPDASAGAKLDTAHAYPVAHARLEPVELKFLVGDDVVSTFVGDDYDAIAKRYTFTSVATLSTALKPWREAAEDNRSILVRFKVKFFAFYARVLEHMTYAEDNLRNFAEPLDTAAITDTFTSVEKKVNPTDKDWTVTFHEKSVPVAMTATIVSGESGGSGVYKLALKVRASEFGDKALALMHRMIAADWSAYYDNVVNNAACRENVKAFVLRHLPLTRGAKFLKSAYDLGWTACETARDDVLLDDGKRQQAVVKAVRDEIDRFLITANPWGDATNGGAYPTAVHIALAALYERYAATPIGIYRQAVKTSLTVVEGLQFLAQMGMGNCQEHANITFAVFKDLMTDKSDAATMLRYVVNTGYLNIDHAFVTGGEPPARYVDALARKDSGSRKKNERVDAWDGFAAVPSGGGAGRHGWICDPYLAVGGIASTLAKLGRQERLRQWLDWNGAASIHPAKVIDSVRDDDDAASAGHVHIPMVCDVNAPTITKIEPKAGPSGGGTEVTFTGTHFDSRCLAVFGAAWGTDVVFTNATTAKAKTPAGAAGVVGAALFNGDNKTVYRGDLDDAFTYHDAPTFVAVKQTYGGTDGGKTVTITGTNFVVGQTRVHFHDQEATDVTVSNAQTLTAKTPAHAAGKVAVTVTTPGGKVETADAFAYYVPPAFTAIKPLYGGTDGGFVVTITGTNFEEDLVKVTFGGEQATEVTVVNDTTVTAKTPAHAQGKVRVTILTPGGRVDTDDAYEYKLVPDITSITPSSGKVGATVKIVGDNFGEGTTVRFGKTYGEVRVVDAQNLFARAPANDIGPVTIYVVSPDRLYAFREDGFTYE